MQIGGRPGQGLRGKRVAQHRPKDSLIWQSRAQCLPPHPRSEGRQQAKHSNHGNAFPLRPAPVLFRRSVEACKMAGGFGGNLAERLASTQTQAGGPLLSICVVPIHEDLEVLAL